MFIFKGISSDDMEVIAEEEDNLLGKASQRYVKTEIEGRNGALFEEQGYTTIDRIINIQIMNLKKLDLIISWLDGVGILEYKNRKTTARFYNEIDLVRAACIKTAEVQLTRNPFWTKVKDDYIKVNNNIFNEGNIYAEPIIKLEKKESDSVDISINDVRFTYNFGDDESVEIDCEEKEATYNNLNRNRKLIIDYKFPVCLPGENKVIINSGDANIYVKRKDRWL